MEDEKLPFTEHLEELRKRLVISAIAVGIGFLASYGFAEQLYMLLAQPAKAVMQDDNSFIFTSLTEAFFTYLKLALFSGVFGGLLALMFAYTTEDHIFDRLLARDADHSGPQR